MDLQEEKELVERARRDPEAFGRLFDLYYSKIFSYVLRRVGDTVAAEEIAAAVFHQALAKLWQFQWRSIPFSAWLYRIAANAINLHFRQALRRKNVSLDALLEAGFEPASPQDLSSELERVESEIERHTLFLRARALLRELPDLYQQALALRYFEEKKIEEIAVILGKKPGTVKSLLSRGLEKIRRAMQPDPSQRILESERSIRPPALRNDPRL